MKKVIVVIYVLIVVVLVGGIGYFIYEKRIDTEYLTIAEKRLEKIEWIKDATIYEVNWRQYTKEGTIKAFEKHLSRLKEMGVKVLWLMPIHPISEINRLGSLGSYYSVKNYTEVNSELGTMNDFKAFVKKAHSMGFKVILDWVANHTGWDNVWMEHKSWYAQDENGNVISPPGTNWTDVAELNYDNLELRKAMIDAMIFWIKNTDIDGFRCDYAGGVPLDFWEEAREKLQKIKPIFMLAEDDQNIRLLDKAFDANYGWKLYNLFNNIAKGNDTAESIIDYYKRIYPSYPKGTFPLLFITNHDENSWNGTEIERLGDAYKTFAVLTFTLPGIPLIYSGQEIPLEKRLKFFDKDEIDWSNIKLHTFYKQLINLKKDNPALWNGSYGGEAKFITTNDSNVLAFVREKGDNIVISIFNLQNKMTKVAINFDLYKGKFRTFGRRDETIIINGKEVFKLEPWEYIILVKK
ncbi:alpha amylase catalytic region [Caldicellulosiruptor hydrothermalis 108]|uniref:Alpha amylase catalytic region n=1 Tax=Caldicellulosiruptor hydrothermalis (strain DSM 18901 / VKM B-2411 / 108) TaxID=632292 RepID=E4Q8U6_CALH1|nr:alpha-amylase family glycosyl hydrolase [Caldicellulosiruptor hydrothermalis]ADQ08070.1 alpha amylase catalytic region [Caldicellulosiruptor hydrothermalis 108]